MSRREEAIAVVGAVCDGVFEFVDQAMAEDAGPKAKRHESKKRWMILMVVNTAASGEK